MTSQQQKFLFGIIVPAVAKIKGYESEEAQDKFKSYLKEKNYIKKSRKELTQESASEIIDRFVRILKF